jgi:hypothetical protein
MTYTIHKPTTKRLFRGEPGFNMVDGVKVVPRAEIVVLKECPTNMVDMLNYAIAKGYIQPVANVRDEELVWEKLTDNS